MRLGGGERTHTEPWSPFTLHTGQTSTALTRKKILQQRNSKFKWLPPLWGEETMLASLAVTFVLCKADVTDGPTTLHHCHPYVKYTDYCAVWCFCNSRCIKVPNATIQISHLENASFHQNNFFSPTLWVETYYHLRPNTSVECSMTTFHWLRPAEHWSHPKKSCS